MAQTLQGSDLCCPPLDGLNSEGKENIERILESLDAEGCGVGENFENYSRVSIRRLGRLLPDARWDGSGEMTNTFENMWDFTPELPEEYTFETALADLIDNSLQAVWLNCEKHRRLISVDVLENKISIFDTGPRMDNSDENSIVKWGKMGASLNRLSKVKAIGCKPPFLVPFFGMFGYGGPVASMHLWRYILLDKLQMPVTLCFVLIFVLLFSPIFIVVL